MPVFNAEKGIQDWTEIPPDTVKIVLGPSPGSDEDDDAPFRLPPPPEDFAAQFPQLTHLYIWSAKELDALPPFPEALRVLDLRGCSGLRKLPDLPERLEELDLGECSSLEELPEAPVALQRLFFNQCDALEDDELQPFLKRLRKSGAPLVEIDASGSRLTKFTNIPRDALRKLVAKDCPELKDIRAVSEFEALQHLNLSGCGEIVSLPKIPATLQYLALSGAENLHDFCGQGLAPSDRGGGGENVCGRFRTRQKFGGRLESVPYAKLLLIGNPGVGKTTLAKRLQWDELTDEERKRFPKLKPRIGEPATHAIQYYNWHTGFTLPEGKDPRDPKSWGISDETTLDLDAQGRFSGGLGLWDFGGQDIYHDTHRAFAGQGSVFLILWTDGPPPKRELPAGCGPEEAAELARNNHWRSLDYWLDYVYSVADDPKIVLVCSQYENPDRPGAKPDWTDKAPKYKEKGKKFDVFFVDSLDFSTAPRHSYRDLVKWIRANSGASAVDVGVSQPAFFHECARMVHGWLAGGEYADASVASGELVGDQILSWKAWRSKVANLHESYRKPQGVLEELVESDVLEIARYLHEAGQIFLVESESEPIVLIDQRWAIDKIYELLRMGSELWKATKENGGVFYEATLETDEVWRKVRDEWKRGRLLEIMEQCRVVTFIGESSRMERGRRMYLATDPSLLPPLENVANMIDFEMDLLKSDSSMMERESFEFEKLTVTSFEFRSLQAHLAKIFKDSATYFRNGLQAIRRDGRQRYCLCLSWKPEDAEAVFGRLDATLVTWAERLGAEVVALQELLFGSNSPLHEKRVELSAFRRPIRETDSSREFFGPARYDVAISNSGAENERVTHLMTALDASDVEVTQYTRPGCRVHTMAKLRSFLDSLREPPCIILVFSESYLRIDPESNQYIPYELADAICRLASGERSAARTIVLYSGDAVRSRNLLDWVPKLLRTTRDFYWDEYTKGGPEESRSRRCFLEMHEKIAAALDGDCCGLLFNERGFPGTYLKLPEGPDDHEALSAIVEAVKNALGKPNSP